MSATTIEREGAVYNLKPHVDPLTLFENTGDLREDHPHPPPSDYTTPFPKNARPGDRIGWGEVVDGEYVRREGVVIDRAPQGATDDAKRKTGQERRASYLYNTRNLHHKDIEAGGYWLWVLADDGETVRVRYHNRGKRKGQARRDDGPMLIRQFTRKPFVVDHVSELSAALGVVA